MPKVYVCDIEADGLLDEATKIHCLSYTSPGSDEVQTLTSYDDMREFVANADTLIGHNFFLYDILVLEKILGIKANVKIIDTLALSWYLNHTRTLHGLESYGRDYGVPKPEVNDWKNLSLEEYCHRCEEDVKINQRVWADLKGKLLRLYDNDRKQADRFLSYLMFKMECVQLQHRSKWKLDKEKALLHRDQLLVQQEEKVNELKLHMPRVQKYAAKTRPAKPFKKDGSLSTLGARWFALLREKGLPEDYDGEVKVPAREEEPNPGSHAQVKEWLFSLGWEPANFKFERNDDGTERSIPQVRVEGEDGKELCPSVLLLADKHPEILVLEGLTVIQHRLSIFEGFLENEKDGYLVADIGGLTNTLRLKHRILVNLPGVHKPWGEEIRGCLIAPDGWEVCGADMTSLEDNTKRHYIYPYDPDYVKEMSRPGFDPHLDLALFAGAVTQEEIDAYVNKVKGGRDLSLLRKGYKVTNYSATYGVRPKKLSRTSGLPIKEAERLLDAFWKRNWAIKKFAEDATVKTCDKGTWVYNPVSKFWYSLRNEKDIFSTVNQSTGVFCFDSWIKAVLARRKQLTAQFHDEGAWVLKKGKREQMEKLLRDSIQEVNDNLKLNIQLDIDVKFGDSYAAVH